MSDQDLIDYDFPTALKHMGISSSEAEQRLEKLDFDQLLTLLDALRTNDKARTRQLLGLSDGQFHEALVPMADSGLGEREQLASDGFNYTLVPHSVTTHDKIIEWLDSNGFDYEVAPNRHIHVKCRSREDCYRLSRALSRIDGRYLRDDAAEPEHTVESMNKHTRKKVKGYDKKFVGNRAELPVTGPTNPLRKELATNPAYRSRREPGGNEEQQDGWSRKAKHKKVDIDEMFNIGDKVRVGEAEGTVKIPHGPGGTVGVLLDGDLQMVNDDELFRVDEGVMGMTQLPGLQRIRELAGIRDDVDAAPPPVDDVDNSEPVGFDMDNGVDDDEFDDMHDVGDMPSQMAPAEPTPPIANSPAFGQIDDALNNVQRALSDIKMSEYKPLVGRLEELLKQARSLGQQYLGEGAGRRAAAAAKKSHEDDKKGDSTSVVIRKVPDTDEYRVNSRKGPESTAYYTNDFDDAVGTARKEWPGAKITHRGKVVEAKKTYRLKEYLSAK